MLSGMVRTNIHLDTLFTVLSPEELIRLHRGQGLDIYWRDAYKCPTEEEYVDMALGSQCVNLISDFTAHFRMLEASGVLRASVRIMMTCATTNTNVCVSVDTMQAYTDSGMPGTTYP